MVCASCGRASQPGARFCGGCGKPFAPRCPACGAAGEPGASFCQACGAALAAPAREDPAARKVVTIVFADLKGSTPLQERLDPESSQRFMNRYHDAMRAEVEAERGVVTQLLGDGVKAVFGVPRVAEDDALRAVRAGLAMQRAFRALSQAEAGRVGEIGLRVAVNTGEVVASAEREIIGDPVTVAAQLQQEARVGDVVIAEPTRRLVAELVTLAPLGAFAVKGRAERVPAYRVVSLERPAGASATAFVGRESELARIRAVFDDAVANRAARLAVILGSPGLGKSRLIGEVARRLAESATVLTARCDSAGGATFAPVAAALRAQLGIADGVSGEALHAAIHAATSGEAPERARVATGIAALLAGTPASHQETFFVVRRFLAGVAAERPAVLVLDDLQWAEPLLLDLVEHLVQWSANTPLLVLVGARPELREARSSLTAPGALVAEVVTLAGLDAAAATRLAANAIGADELPAAVAGRVLTASEGNPLFVGELVRMLVQDGVLVREGERWTTDAQLSALQMPPTIQALLAARIERLRPDERTVLERAAVIGRQFSRAALAELLPREVNDLDRVLEALRRSELVESDSGWFLGEPALRFHHVLTRDAAYRRLLKNRRAELHERFADWVLRRVGDEAPHDETIGWHLEQAHQHLSELGPLDSHGRELGERAARYLGAAGRRALERDDLPLAASLLGRAVARLGEDDPARAELALDWCEALLSAGEVAAAAAAIDEFGRFAHLSPRLRAWHTCFAGQRAALTDPDSLRATVGAVSAAAETLSAEGDTAGEAKGHLVHAQALARLGRMGACEAALDRAQAAARRMHDRRRANTVLAAVPLAVLSGPSPVTRASGRCLDVVRVLRITQGSPAVEAVALRCQGVLEALRGRSEAARRMVASSRRMVEELGITHRLLEADVFAGRIELIEGDAAAAERCLRPAYEGLRAQGLGIDAAQAAALLARALLLLGRVAEAEALSHESEKLAGDDLPASIAWRCVRAEALARRGDHAGAVELAQAAVQLAAATDVLLDHADARLALAAALHAAGRGAEAAAEEARAIELWEAKGATRLAERARRTVGRAAEPPPRAPEAPVQSRRVQQNYATDHMRRLDAAVLARDRAAIASLMAGNIEQVDHVSGRHFDGDSILELLSQVLERSDRLAFVNQPIAALGPSLALARSVETASQLVSGDLPIGPYEIAYAIVLEADAGARCTYLESFAADRLGNAVARLYERYAETLPDGPERARANAAARAVAALTGPFDLARYAESFAPGIEYRDRRAGGDRLVGRAAVLQWLQTLPAIADDVSNRFDDVLGSSPEALLLRFTNSGTERTGKSRFERPILWLGTFSAEGIAGIEVFEGDRDAEALARFDELVGRPSSIRSAQRRKRTTTVSDQVDRLNAAFAAGDTEAITPLLSERLQVIDHKSGAVVDARGIQSWLSLFLGDRDAVVRIEPLAVLGDSLVLNHLSWSGSASNDPVLAVGAFDASELDLVELEAGRAARVESFANDRLGEAIVRLYERYAELQPEGPARERAAATARDVRNAAMPPVDHPERALASLAASIERVDHRTVGFPATRGHDGFMQTVRSLSEHASDLSFRVDDVLAARPDALLWRIVNNGTDRRTGGSFERAYLALAVYGADGRAIRSEQFDPDREAEALARFDELTGPRRALRRVRPNAATASEAALERAVADRDAAGIAAHVGELREVVHHPTGETYAGAGSRETFRGLLAAVGGSYRSEPLATLGDSLALCLQLVSARGAGSRTWDVGPYEMENLVLAEVDGRGRRVRTELFSAHRLGDAVVRLYERYAELLPAGAARERASATARHVATAHGPMDLDHLEATYSPEIEHVDHRRAIGLGTTRGRDAFRQALQALVEAAPDASNRTDEVLAARPDALLRRVTNSGTDRATGGAFERVFLMLTSYGVDGRVTRAEQFDPDRAADALARFDGLSRDRPAPTRRRVRDNTVTAQVARMNAAMARRDVDALRPLHAEGVRFVHHTTGAVMDLQATLEWWRLFFADRDAALQFETLATLGESLALLRLSWTGSASHDSALAVGEYEGGELDLVEVDAEGRAERIEGFALDRLGEALARLYERYAARLPEGPARERAAATVRTAAAMFAPFDPDRRAPAMAPDIDYVDDRAHGAGRLRGREAVVEWLRTSFDVGENVVTRFDDVLAFRPDAMLLRRTNVGTVRASGGSYEQHFVLLGVFSPEGLISRIEIFEPEREAEALARFDELTAAPAEPWFANAATRAMVRMTEAWNARDWPAIEACYAPEARLFDRRNVLELDRAGLLELHRAMFEMESSLGSAEVLATRGERLALGRILLQVSSGDVGASELESLNIVELNERGQRIAAVRFDPDDLDAAYAELDRRYTERVVSGYDGVGPAIAARDWDAVAAGLSPELVVRDHRPLGFETLHGVAAYLESLRALMELAPDARLRVDHVRISGRARLSLTRWVGTREGGDFEVQRVVVTELDLSGRACRFDFYEPEQIELARAQFESLAQSKPRSIPPNAATQAREHAEEAALAADWTKLRALASDDFQFLDRGKQALVDTGIDGWIENLRFLREQGAQHRRELVATAGDRTDVERVVFGRDPAAGALELGQIVVVEVASDGRLRAVVRFDPDDRRAAFEEAAERFVAGEAAGVASQALIAAYNRAFARSDVGALRACLADDFVVDDRRSPNVLGTLDRDEWLASVAALAELAPDWEFEAPRILAWNERGGVQLVRVFGTREGGPFENLDVRFMLTDGARVQRVELFDLADTERALARFAELCAEPSSLNPLAIPPNAATRARERVDDAVAAADWARLRALASDDFQFLDRGKQALVDTGIDGWIGGLRFLREQGAQHRRELVATAGDRIDVERIVFARGAAGGALELGQLVVTEVAGDGRLRAVVRFDPDDRRAAFGEAVERFVAGEAAGVSSQVLIAKYSRAFGSSDVDPLRTCLADDFVVDDLRSPSVFGALDRDQWLESVATLAQLAPDYQAEVPRILAWNERGAAQLIRIFGTREGGPFENLFVRIILTDGERVQRVELFNVEDIERALARLAELC